MTYNIGPLTMEYVFKRTGMTNVSDMQAVFDAMESGIREAQISAAVREIDRMQNDD